VGEIMGTARLFAWCHDNPAVNMEPSDVVHDPQVVARLGDFVSVNSALEVDLLGQVNAESVGGRQVAGIGGQFDFVLGAARAAAGRGVIARAATGRLGQVSRRRDGVRGGGAAGTERRRAATRADPHRPPGVEGAPGGAYRLSLSISTKISASSGKRKVSWLL
jgi:hypothetical protein